MRHGEFHRIQHIGWLRAAVLGANDGIISTSSLMMGFASAQVSGQGILLSGVAGLVAGALSMAAGEYVSVRSQADTEAADIAREKDELKTEPDSELKELTEIYIARGLTRALAEKVATELTAKDALKAHLRDELGILEITQARPLQAAIASAVTFALGALIPIIVSLLAPATYLHYAIPSVSLVALIGLGALAANVGGSNRLSGGIRVGVWGAAAMAITSFVGQFFGVSV
jgi:VIT1/CCC1 family predicted Fe2+/Mn2+ transporter